MILVCLVRVMWQFNVFAVLGVTALPETVEIKLLRTYRRLVDIKLRSSIKKEYA